MAARFAWRAAAIGRQYVQPTASMCHFVNPTVVGAAVRYETKQQALTHYQQPNKPTNTTLYSVLLWLVDWLVGWLAAGVVAHHSSACLQQLHR